MLTFTSITAESTGRSELLSVLLLLLSEGVWGVTVGGEEGEGEKKDRIDEGRDEVRKLEIDGKAKNDRVEREQLEREVYRLDRSDIITVDEQESNKEEGVADSADIVWDAVSTDNSEEEEESKDEEDEGEEEEEEEGTMAAVMLVASTANDAGEGIGIQLWKKEKEKGN